MAPGDSTGHRDQHFPGCGTVLRSLHGVRLPTKPWSSTWLSMTSVLDINYGPGFSYILFLVFLFQTGSYYVAPTFLEFAV